jgi:peptidoglycan hydrolase-like protein with peptidoglycan-binding domain
VRRTLAVLVTLGCLAAAGALLAVLALGEDTQATDDVTVDRDTVAVERRTLAETEQVSGELGYDDARTVTAGAGQGTVTWLPAEGATVKRGGTLYRVDDEPVLLLTGRLPLWRELSYGAEGRDVAQLERNLSKLGYDPGTVDETFTSHTREAVEDLQADRGLEETGIVTADRFVVLPAAVRVGTHDAGVGTPLQPGGRLYDATGTGRVVTVDLDTSQEALAEVGAPATVTLPDGTTTAATVSEVGTVASPVSGGESEEPTAEATIPVTLTLAAPKQVAGLSAAPVTVDLTRDRREGAVAVPVTALVALAEGGYAVRRVGGELAAVEPGLYAGGYVEILSGLAEGDRIEVAE